ncbi:hypothetical protein BDV93DRAFT_558185 [Ceratobasidium sp. AG-I]|nr:hypothetical protein BDV93DRAFT_558185 [Ceratobasidium sp. AG-I]
MTMDVSLVAIFGATGTGKTTFVNDASSGDLRVGHKSHACTQDVETSPVFQVDGRNVVLFDTLGLDDTHMSDTEVLQRITGFLATSYQQGHELTGIIYLHRITDIRVGGISRRTFNVFRKLCGKESLSNVLIVTNMWSDPPTERELEREEELRSHLDFFQEALAKGATLVCREPKSPKSAQKIIRLLLKKQPTVMGFQRELVDEKKELSETGAGQVLTQELKLAMERHKAEMQAELSEWQAEAQAAEAKRQEEMESLKKGFGEEHAKWKKLIDDANAEHEAAEASDRKAREELEEARRMEREAAEHNRREMQEKIAQLERDINSKGGCLIA